MTEYMDPSRPKPVGGPTGIDIPPPVHNPPAPSAGPGSFEEGQGNYRDRSDRSVPIGR